MSASLHELKTEPKALAQMDNVRTAEKSKTV